MTRDRGLSFLKSSYATQLTTASTILARVDQDALAADIDRIAGPEYLAHVRYTHVRYDRMVKDMLQNRSADGVAAIDEFRANTQSRRSNPAPETDPDETDPETDPDETDAETDAAPPAES